MANTSEGIAFDWVNRNLYWVNTDIPKSIEVLSYDGRYPSTAILKDLDMPRDVAVDPLERYPIIFGKYFKMPLYTFSYFY